MRSMTNQLATARAAIAAEIKHLAAEQMKLEKVLAQLDGRPSGGSMPAAPQVGTKRRGRPPMKQQKAASASDLQTALGIIEQSGKKGIKAIKLAYEVKKVGATKPEKADLLGSEKVKMIGKGGGSTYVWTA